MCSEKEYSFSAECSNTSIFITKLITTRKNCTCHTEECRNCCIKNDVEFQNKLYSDDISGETTIAKLENKIVIIIVTSTANIVSTNPNINKVKMEEICKRSEFYNGDSSDRNTKSHVLHTHLTGNAEYMHQTSYDVVKQPTENNPTAIFTVKMPELNDPINEYANAHFDRKNVIQPMKFYVIDNPLVEYEEIFNNQGTAYIELG